MSNVMHRRGKINHSFSSSHIFHTSDDQGILKRMEGLEEIMKLIMTTLNIGGVKNRGTKNENVRIASINTYMKNPVKDNILVHLYK